MIEIASSTALVREWWDWGVQAAVALATLVAALVALFGNAIRGKFLAPKLSLSIADPAGEKTQIRFARQGPTGQQVVLEDCSRGRRCCTSKTRWSPAHQVQVVLLSVQEKGADGQFAITWIGDMPTSWRHQEAYAGPRTIGPDGYADLCSVVRGQYLALHPLIAPNNVSTRRQAPVDLLLQFQARSNEADSPVLSVRVSWDGGWNEGAIEMQRHLAVRPHAA